jgi:hypothetical protein
VTDTSMNARSPGLPDVTVRMAKQPHPLRPSGATTGGGWVPSDDELLDRTLAFSGSFVSDDGQVTIRRSGGSSEYLAARFTGVCAVCVREGLTPPSGEPLSDSRAAARFATAHHHGEVD